ncbi:unnamed protein product [Rotaria magnacalcarata]|uniref:Mono(ADP-ribosyl)transferase n=3 Tax=Rotaria magnacalcarata TaxID=392030 RepID=A0A816UWK2_9BILA|nr:unnamed protein product [Rotaria magnacalcarata]
MAFRMNDFNPRLIHNSCDRPDLALLPISGYEKLEPVPLETAVEPIQSLFRDLSRDVSIAKAATKRPADGLTPDESAAVYLYTLDVKPRSFCLVLNEILCHRDRQKLKPWQPYLRLFFNGVFKIPAYAMKIIWHGVKADLQAKYETGKSYTWWAITSCAQSVDVLQNPAYLGETGVRTVFSIECLNGRPIKAHSCHQRDEEILLLPGTYFEVISNVNTGHGLQVIRSRERPPPYVLLEPPFSTGDTEAEVFGIDEILEKVYLMNKDNLDMSKLLVVLPDPTCQWEPEDIWKNSFLIYLVCECSTNRIHFAMHPGYAVPNAQIFFQIYGLYFKQYMIQLAQYLLKLKSVNTVQDTNFWSTFESRLNKMPSVLNLIEQNLITALDTSNLKDLVVPEWSTMGNLYRAITSDMNVRWVCKRHYPSDQAILIRRLRDFEGISFDDQESEMTIHGALDSVQMRRLTATLLQGLRIYSLNYVYYTPALDQLNKTFCRASIITVCHRGILSDSNDKSNMERIQKLCSQVIASNPFVRQADLSDAGGLSRKLGSVRDAIKTNHKLRSFTFCGAMTNQGITEIITAFQLNMVLTTLRFKDRPLPPRGAEVLAELIRSSGILIHLTLSNTMLKDDGLRMIADAVCANPIMQTLELSFNRIHDKSGPYIGYMLKVCTSLRSLDISYNEMSAIGAKRIFDRLKVNRTLLHFNIGLNNLAVRSVKQTMSLKNPPVNGGQLVGNMLAENNTLITLDITHINMSEFGVQGIAESLLQNRTLTHLNLASNKIFDIQRRAILDAMHTNDTLLSLDLSHNKMDDASVIRLGEMLRVNRKLRFFRAKSCVIEDSRMYSLARTLDDKLTLTHLDLSKNKIGDDGAAMIGDILAKNNTLIYLNISENRITDQGVQAIANSLEMNFTLIHLEMLAQQANITVFAMVTFRSIRPDLTLR